MGKNGIYIAIMIIFAVLITLFCSYLCHEVQSSIGSYQKEFEDEFCEQFYL